VKIADTVLKQPQIALWNLYHLANALHPHHRRCILELILNDFQDLYENEYLAMMRKKK
jgi:uncharacterized protein YdiU (UPF0061 family)